ncbi:MAG TPA: sulfite exporter TauE/SafE family protein [Isosphaeraceae bacterium]|nr:sulfite exporter TauE/SafE family protein [Isosphaeraceae bacterium]
MTEFAEVFKMIVLGLAAGVLSGLFGIGGGLVIVPALVLMFGFGIKTAVGTSLFVILLPTGLLGVLEYYKNGEMKIAAGLWIAFGVFCGAYFGAVMAGAVPAITMRRLYAVFLLVVATYFLVAPERVTKRAPAPPTGVEAVPGGRD